MIRCEYCDSERRGESAKRYLQYYICDKQECFDRLPENVRTARCVVCNEQATEPQKNTCDKLSCKLQVGFIFGNNAQTKVKMFPQRQKYADKMTSNWKEIADRTGFNYDGTPKT